MPILQTRVPPYKPTKDKEFSWESFRGGLNTILKENEIKPTELSQMDNLMLVGKGVPTKRWGTSTYFLAGESGAVRGLKGYYQTDGTVELLAATDDGFLTKKSNASYSTLTGASWASGYNTEMAQLDDTMYIVNPSRELVNYDGSTLSSFATLSSPSATFATQISGASGTNSYSYRVSTVSEVGETLAAASYLLTGQPQDLIDGSAKVNWTAPSAASGLIKGYNVYGRDEGDETFLGSVDGNSTDYIDDGTAIPSSFTFVPLADTTGGIKAKYIVRFQDRLVYAGVDGEPSTVVISGKAPNHEKNDVSFGGNFIRIEPDAGDDVTGLAVFKEKIIVFKERSIWQVALTELNVGNFVITQPVATLLTGSVGCIAPRSITNVENDIFFLSRNGVYSVGNESGFFDVLRSNEISSRVRPFFDGLTTAEKQNACGVYKGFKYILSVPGKGQTIVMDRERLAWMGPWFFDANVYEVFFDSSNDEVLVFGNDDDTNAIEVDDRFINDNGTAINTILRTKKEDFGDWMRFKNIKLVFTQFREVTGDVSVDVRLQERSGNVITAKSFNVSPRSGSAGWGSGQWADAQWGDSEEAGGASDINEIYRWMSLNKAGRNIQFTVKTDNNIDNYQLLGLRAKATPMGLGFLPAGEKV